VDCLFLNVRVYFFISYVCSDLRLRNATSAVDSYITSFTAVMKGRNH
jgi:hypothetical protein